ETCQASNCWNLRVKGFANGLIMFLSRYSCLAWAFTFSLLLISIFSARSPARGLTQDPHASQPGDTIIILDEILIESTRIYEPVRYQPVDVQVVDSLHLAMDRTMPLSVILARYTSLYIRDNGPGGMASLSQRGLSPGQTQVLWEGFPLNSLSLGMADLSLIPAGLFGSVEVSPGTPSSAFGGGSLGGTVYLSSSRPQQPGMEVQQSAGAFGTYQSLVGGRYGKGRWSVSMQALYRRADNDFSYENRANGLNENRRNNAGRGGQLMGNFGYRLQNVRIYSTVWFSDREEQIPGSILTGSSEARQSDRSVRFLTGLETSVDGWNLSLRSLIDRDVFHYVDPPANTDSHFQTGRWLVNLDITRPSPGAVVWKGGLSGGLEMVNTGNYSDKYRRNSLGLRLDPVIRLAGGSLRVTPTARLDAYTDFGGIFSPSLGINWKVAGEHLHLKGMISRDFNPPTFNDLYWVPGGNPGLEPERSLKGEGGFIYLPAVPLIESVNMTGYRIWLDDGIYWFPSGDGVWSPANVEKVDAYGMESRINLRWQVRSAVFRWILGADYRKAEIARMRFPGDQAAGRQMRYVPAWSTRSTLSINLDPVALNAAYRRTGRRYITEDHSSGLDPFQVLDLSMNYKRDFLQASWQIRLAANNILDERYEIIQWYPMPGRHLEFSLSVGL
ncbi:MAG: TonB-dependent receptor plug domain-containing protein, partial [Balneolales bacterium]